MAANAVGIFFGEDFECLVCSRAYAELRTFELKSTTAAKMTSKQFVGRFCDGIF